MNCVLKYFEGKNTQIRSMVVEDINDKDIARPGMNVDKLAGKYAEDLDTLNAGQGINKVAYAPKEVCSYCGKEGHAAIDSVPQETMG